jgi:parvulin-like peptidyl-prolyl isomerase
MNMIKKKACIMLAVCALLAANASALFAQQDLQPVAIVKLTKPEPITVKQFRQQLDQMEKLKGGALTASERRQILDTMINDKLATQAAARDRITVSDAEVNQQIQTMRQQMSQQLGRNPTDSEFNNAIQQQYGMNLSAFREEAKKQLTLQRYMMEKKRALFDTYKDPTDADVEAEYELRRSQFTVDETAQFWSIYVSDANEQGGPPTAAAKSRARAEIDRLNRQINGSVSVFDDLVVKGQTAGLSYMGTTAGVIRKNVQARQETGLEFMNAVFGLEQGKVSPVLEVPSGQAAGFYLVKVIGKMPARLLGLNDMITEYNMTVRNYIKANLAQERQEQLIMQAQAELVQDLRKGNPFEVIERNMNF